MTLVAPLLSRIEDDQAAVALYHGTVRHRRDVPVARTFARKMLLAYLDVDALPGTLDDLPFWSARRVAPVRFRRRDFFDGGTEPLGAGVRDLVELRIGQRPRGRIFLLAQLRTFGSLFNPLAVYYCWDAGGVGLDAIVLEVTNTPWGERQWYVIDARASAASTRVPKLMHVSPFLPMDVEYRVTWSEPGAALRLRIDVERGGTRIFGADLALRRAPLDRRNAVTFPMRAPLLPLRGLLAIYREALRLFLRRVPLYRHPARGAERSAR